MPTRRGLQTFPDGTDPQGPTTNSTSVGTGQTVSGDNAVAVGNDSQAGADATAVGSAAMGNNSQAVSIGRASFASVQGTSLGYNADAIGVGGIAIGRGAGVGSGHTDGIALGRNSDTTAANRLTMNGGTIEMELNGGIGEFGSTPPAAQPAAIADVPTAGSATAADNATAINAILAVLRARGTIAT